MNKAMAIREHYKEETRKIYNVNAAGTCAKYVRAVEKQVAQRNMRILLRQLNGPDKIQKH